MPPLTWVSDIASVLQNGFTPVFADIDRRTLGDGHRGSPGQDHAAHARRLPHPRARLRRPHRRAARRAREARHPADRGRVRVARRHAQRPAPRQLRLGVELLLLLRAPHEHHRGRHGVHRRPGGLPADPHAALARHGARGQRRRRARPVAARQPRPEPRLHLRVPGLQRAQHRDRRDHRPLAAQAPGPQRRTAHAQPAALPVAHRRPALPDRLPARRQQQLRLQPGPERGRSGASSIG